MRITGLALAAGALGIWLSAGDSATGITPISKPSTSAAISIWEIHNLAHLEFLPVLAQDLPNPQPITQVTASTGASPATEPAAALGRTFSRTGENHRLFFGFLEFDWDRNAPGGVPGFGPLEKSAAASAAAALTIKTRP